MMVSTLVVFFSLGVSAASGLGTTEVLLRQREHAIRKVLSRKNLGNYPSRRALLELFEGDIIPDYPSIVKAYGSDFAESLANDGLLVRSSSPREVEVDKRWSIRIDSVAAVPYTISNDFTEEERAKIVYAMKDLADRSKVVSFVPHESESNYLEVKVGSSCSASVGMLNRGGQTLTLDPKGCMIHGIIQHELLHALGFWHEQNRPDRDSHVDVHLENVLDGFEHNFKKQTDSQSLGSEYDYGSVMHYPAKGFSKNGLATVEPPEGVSIGQRDEADDVDIHQIQLLYQCISGPRAQDAATATPCSADCKCWQGATGCGSSNDSCQGELVCSENECICKEGSACWPGVVTSAEIKRGCGFFDIMCWIAFIFNFFMGLFGF